MKPRQHTAVAGNIARVALPQLLGPGPFTQAEALRVGYTLADIRSALRCGRWIRLRRRVYISATDYAAVANNPSALHAAQVQALLLALSRVNIAGAEHSAARVHGFALLQPSPKDLIVCTDDPAVRGTHRDGYFLRVAPLPAQDVQHLHGTRVTTPARTLLDLAANVSFRQAVVAADSACHQALVRPAELIAAVDAACGRPGVRQAREVFSFVDPKAESVLESISRVAMRDLRIPMPRTQSEIRTPGGRYKVDFDWWPELDLIGEADGLEKYLPPTGTDRAATVAALRKEKQREADLLQVRREIIRWGWPEANDPRLLAALLLPAIARAQARRVSAG
jgi:hypothetical protein